MAYESGWRKNKASGEIDWTSSWVDGSNFQQLKGSKSGNSSLDEEFAGLSKSDSDVDDDGAWVTLKQQAGEGATADAKALADKWQAAGYDVRIQDLEGAEGTTQADIAVRKRAAEAKGFTEPTERTESKELSDAKERVQAWMKGQGTGPVNTIYNDSSDEQLIKELDLGAKDEYKATEGLS